MFQNAEGFRKMNLGTPVKRAFVQLQDAQNYWQEKILLFLELNQAEKSRKNSKIVFQKRPFYSKVSISTKEKWIIFEMKILSGFRGTPSFDQNIFVGFHRKLFYCVQIPNPWGIKLAPYGFQWALKELLSVDWFQSKISVFEHSNDGATASWASFRVRAAEMLAED